ncbi:MAG: phosphate acyltransferase PlsX [Alphaproteobacteria bacterium]|nr:phosphate acyltransferase PlsX [Alphaproteobacteria bacterium]
MAADGLVLSIDGMGGDAGPGTVVEGVAIAARRWPRTRFLVHGDAAQLTPLVSRHAGLSAVAGVRAAERAIGMEMKPAQALRQGKGTSLWNAVEAVKDGEAHAAVSAGNTGAFMAISMFRLRTMAGVHRPALTAGIPNARALTTVMLDVGANVEADASQLVEFAIMGEAFFRALYGVERPTIGLLNVGAEDQKGHEEIRTAARLIRDRRIDMDFRGFVEGDDICKGGVDVVVTDGFTGNIALKSIEGAARLVGQFLRESLTSGPLAQAGAALAYPALKKLRKRMDPSTNNGAVFLGLNGVVVKSHGSANAEGFAAAIDVAVRLARSHYRDEIARNIARLGAGAETTAEQRDAS